jgi:hypothetical protein
MQGVRPALKGRRAIKMAYEQAALLLTLDWPGFGNGDAGPIFA